MKNDARALSRTAAAGRCVEGNKLAWQKGKGEKKNEGRRGEERGVTKRKGLRTREKKNAMEIKPWRKEEGSCTRMKVGRRQNRTKMEQSRHDTKSTW